MKHRKGVVFVHKLIPNSERNLLYFSEPSQRRYVIVREVGA